MDNGSIEAEIDKLNEIIDFLNQNKAKISYKAIGEIYDVSRQAICARKYLRPIIEQHKAQQYLERASTLAQVKSGLLLSPKFQSCNAKMEWKCSDSTHPSFIKSYNQVFHNQIWCPECSKATKDLQKASRTRAKAIAYAKDRGGQLLSSEVSDIYEVVNWKCSNPTHPLFRSSYNNLANYGRWCRNCLELGKGVDNR